MNRKQLFTMILIVIITPIIINIIIVTPSPEWVPKCLAEWVEVKNIDPWISYFGSYCGGIVGGIVAYIIAKTEIKAQKEIEQNRNFIEQLPTLVKLDMELAKLNKNLSSFHKMSVSQDFQAVVMSPITFTEGIKINLLCWNNIEKINDVNLLRDIIKFREFYIKLQRVLTLNLNDITSKLNNVNLRLQKLSKIKNLNVKQQQEKNDLQIELTTLKLQEEVIKTNKEEIWKSIRKKDFLEFPEKLHKTIKDLISEIDSKIKVDN